MTVSYNLFIKRSAEKELRNLPKNDLPKIVQKIQELAKNPRPLGSQKLSEEEQFRIRQADYRIIYTVDDASRRVEILRIGHRKEVYRDK